MSRSGLALLWLHESILWLTSVVGTTTSSLECPSAGLLHNIPKFAAKDLYGASSAK